MLDMNEKPLTEAEMETMAALLERAVLNEQLAIGAPVKGDDSTGHATGDIGCVCDHGTMCIIDLLPKGLKHLWVKHNGAKGGLQKARNARKARKR